MAAAVGLGANVEAAKQTARWSLIDGAEVACMIDGRARLRRLICRRFTFSVRPRTTTCARWPSHTSSAIAAVSRDGSLSVLVQVVALQACDESTWIDADDASTCT